MTALCQCGCGEPAPIAAKTAARYGHVKGEPTRFRKGHSGRRPAIERLLEKVRIDGETGCWRWLGGTHPAGYGTFWNGERHESTHRFVFAFFRGPIPDGLELHHRCRNPACCNWMHLEPIEAREHRSLHPNQHVGKRFCKHGHELTPETAYISKGGRWRRCKTCHRRDVRAYLQRQAAA